VRRDGEYNKDVLIVLIHCMMWFRELQCHVILLHHRPECSVWCQIQRPTTETWRMPSIALSDTKVWVTHYEASRLWCMVQGLRMPCTLPVMRNWRPLWVARVRATTWLMVSFFFLVFQFQWCSELYMFFQLQFSCIVCWCPGFPHALEITNKFS